MTRGYFPSETYLEYLERRALHERLKKQPGYDPVWGLLRSPLTGPDPKDHLKLVVPERSGRSVRGRPQNHPLGRRAA